MTLTAEDIPSDRFEQLIADESIPLVHRSLWLLLWHSDVRVHDLLALDVSDAAAMALASAPGDERAADLLTRLAGDRTAGPLFAVGAERARALTWDQAVRAAAGQGHPIHTFRISGRRHRAAGGDSG